jgi:hypothetical protein
MEAPKGRPMIARGDGPFGPEPLERELIAFPSPKGAAVLGGCASCRPVGAWRFPCTDFQGFGFASKSLALLTT